MTMQFLIDWEGIARERTSASEDRLCAALLRLSEYVRCSGCVVASDCVRSVLAKSIVESGENLSSVLTIWNGIYSDCALQVGEDNDRTLQETIEAWRAHIARTGVVEVRGDGRFVLVGGSVVKNKGEFYLACPIWAFGDRVRVEQMMPGLVKWIQMQHFGASSKCAFLNYLYAFCSCAKSCVRLYDPYLAEMFLPLCKEPRRKAWRNSFHLIYGVFAKNDFIRRIEIVTAFTKDCETYLHDDMSHRLRMDEILGDIIIPAFKLRREDLEISFHVLREKSADFHDRFISNGRSCFAVGHGLDVCREGECFRHLICLDRKGEHIMDAQWRNSPRNDHEMTEFNVFYGCVCKSVPPGVNVFAVCKDDDVSRMYPRGCSAMRGDDPGLLSRFAFGSVCRSTDYSNVYVFENESRNTTLRVALNEFADEDNF